MGTKLNKTTYENEIKIHIDELCKYMEKDTLERRFIIQVLQDSIKCYYPCEGKETPNELQASNCIKHAVSQRSELLLAYEKFHNTCECDSCRTAITEKIEAFLSQ